jgi:thiol-disulfide isomerase/thioredoxin
MRPKAKRLTVALRILLGATFLYSAYAKAYDFGQFELRILEIPGINWQISSWLGVLILTLEYYIGFSFLAIITQQKKLVRLTAAFLIVLSAYLVYLLIAKGNNINCGCMGENLAFTPIQALVKNLIIGLSLFLLDRLPPHKTTINRQKPVQIVIVAASLLAGTITPHDLFPGEIERYETPIPFSSELLLDSSFNPKLNQLSKETTLIAFLSMSCAHCKYAAQRLAHLHDAMPELNMLIILNGDSSEAASFRENHNISKINYSMLGANAFLELAGNSVPAIFLIKQDFKIAKIQTAQLNRSTLNFNN